MPVARVIARFDVKGRNLVKDGILEYVATTEDRFWELIDRFRSPRLWTREGDTWVLRRQVS